MCPQVEDEGKLVYGSRGDKQNVSSDSDADREIPTRGSTRNVGNEVSGIIR